jgi:hypothetical protein
MRTCAARTALSFLVHLARASGRSAGRIRYAEATMTLSFLPALASGFVFSPTPMPARAAPRLGAVRCGDSSSFGMGATDVAKIHAQRFPNSLSQVHLGIKVSP